MGRGGGGGLISIARKKTPYARKCKEKRFLRKSDGMIYWYLELRCQRPLTAESQKKLASLRCSRIPFCKQMMVCVSFSGTDTEYSHAHTTHGREISIAGNMTQMDRVQFEKSAEHTLCSAFTFGNMVGFFFPDLIFSFSLFSLFDFFFFFFRGGFLGRRVYD